MDGAALAAGCGGVWVVQLLLLFLRALYTGGCTWLRERAQQREAAILQQEDALVERGVALWQQLQHWARVLASPLRPVVEAARSRRRDEARAARLARSGKRPHSSRAPGTPSFSGGLGYDEGDPADPYNYTPPPRARRVAKATAKRRAGGLGL